jgi:hypothetical protein
MIQKHQSGDGIRMLLILTPFLAQFIILHKNNFDSLIQKWKEVNNVFRQKLEFSDSVDMPISFLGCLGAALGGDVQKRDLLIDIDIKAHYVYSKLAPELQKKFKNTLINLIKNLGVKESNFLSWVAEVQYFYYILNTETSKIEAIEFSLPNKKSIDCKLRMLDNSILLYDFVSIIPKENRIESEEGFRNYLSDKIKFKYLDKTKAIKDIKLKSTIKICPVIWIDPMFILKYKAMFQNSQTDINVEYYAYYSIKRNENKFTFEFKSVQEFLPK